jgi:hypothetical protein
MYSHQDTYPRDLVFDRRLAASGQCIDYVVFDRMTSRMLDNPRTVVCLVGTKETQLYIGTIKKAYDTAMGNSHFLRFAAAWTGTGATDETRTRYQRRQAQARDEETNRRAFMGEEEEEEEEEEEARDDEGDGDGEGGGDGEEACFGGSEEEVRAWCVVVNLKI